MMSIRARQQTVAGLLLPVGAQESPRLWHSRELGGGWRQCVRRPISNRTFICSAPCSLHGAALQ
jgi:hypothetical protein